MPSPTTIDEFLELVRKSGVVDDKRLSSYLDKARAAQTLPAEPVRLAELLVRDGLVTRFQAEQFLQGKWRRFTIGKYKVLEKLGAGGMGSVYLCEHKLMRRRVAVKVLPTAKADDTSSLERFYREARAVAALDHPNIVRAYDIDQDDKLHFLVMEHVDGSSLQEIIKKAGPMDVLRACHYIRQAALGLQHAHETAGIVHRDIKPGNVLVDRNGIVKVLDMGLARFFHDDEDMLTRKYEDNVLGTADYLAPEQALDSHTVDIRADIYSLGATFYFCLTGRTPFAEGTVAQKLIWHQTRQPKPLRQLRPEVPEGVVAIVEKMMAKDANQRYPTPAAVADALAPWTQTPIPPPPDSEMPQLSPAAMGAAPADPSLVAGPKTPPSGELGPSVRKVWQVSQNATPAPASTPSPSPPPAPRRDLRKTNPPPPGPLNLQAPGAVSVPSPAAEPPPTIRAPAAPARPQVRTVPAPPRPAVPPPIPRKPAGRPAPDNGTAPIPAPAEAEEPPSWADVVTQNGIADPDTDTLPRTARKGSSSKRLKSLPPTVVPPRRLGWAIAIASAIVLVLIILGGLLSWLSGKKPNEETQRAVEPPSSVFHVNQFGSNGASRTLLAAIQQIKRDRARLGRTPTRIIVDDDLAESDVLIPEIPNLTIEAAASKTIVWRYPNPTPTSKLLTVYNAEGFHLKGFTLDGGKQVDTLINIQHRCPAAVFEDLTLKGFTKYGMWITNCEGEEKPERNVLLTRLSFESSLPVQTALFFSIADSMKIALPKNKFIIIRDCKFTGPGGKIKTPDPNTLEHIELPTGVPLEKGQ